MKKVQKFIIGELLHMANHEYHSRSFYEMKDRLLQLHGVELGYDTQHVTKPCRNCDSGYITTSITMAWNKPWKAETVKCPRCGGSSIYDEFWSLLALYQIGRRQFHSPMGKSYTKSRFDNVISKITPLHHFEGLIRHTPPKHNLGKEAAFLLALMFFPGYLEELWFGAFYSKGVFTPMMILNNLVWIKRRWAEDLSRFFLKVKQYFCLHDYESDPFGFRDLDVCKKCHVMRRDSNHLEEPYF